MDVSRSACIKLMALLALAFCVLVSVGATHAFAATDNPGTGLSTNHDWAGLVLQDGGWPQSGANITVIMQWMASENVVATWWEDPSDGSVNNPLNNGLGSGGGSGRGSYRDLPTAAYYVALNLEAPDWGYPHVAADLAASKPATTTASAIWDSDWASGHYGTVGHPGAHWHTSTVQTVAAPPSNWAALTLSSTSGTYGTALTLTTSGGSGTGAVSYAVTTPGSAGCSLNSYGTALSATSAGTCTVTATKAADANYNAASSTATTVTFAKATTKTVLKLSATKVTYGHEQTDLLSVTVSPQFPGSMPTGTVTVKRSTTTLCTITLSSAKGSCLLTHKELPAGSFSIYANYGPNANFVGSTSFITKTILAVTRASTKTTLTLSVKKVNFGHEQGEHLWVSVSPQFSDTTPTGTVTISGTPCRIKLASDKGSCTLSSAKFRRGAHSLVAHYGGSADFVSSTSANKTIDVIR